MAGISARLGFRMAMISPGIRRDQELGRWDFRTRVGRRRSDLGGQVAPHGMADQRKSRGVGPDMPHTVMKNLQGIANSFERVRQEILGQSANVVLIAGKYHDLAIPHQMIDPRAVKPRIDGKPTVKKHDHRRSCFGPWFIGLEDPV